MNNTNQKTKKSNGTTKNQVSNSAGKAEDDSMLSIMKLLRKKNSKN